MVKLSFTAATIALFQFLSLWLIPGVVFAEDAAAKGEQNRPNVLFISVDDLNDWVGCMGGHPQSRTPNIDRLAKSGCLFTNAHCPAPACNPSRSAIMTGVSPHVSGIYDNRQNMRELLPDADLIPKYFGDHGYWSAGSGKIMHYFTDAASWDLYYPPKETENPFPPTLYPKNRPVSLPRAGDWQYIEADWGPLDVSDEEFGGDWLVSKWVSQQLSRKHEQPFFLACGIYRPHEPWFVPKKYFDLFPLETLQLPPGYKEDDLKDLPAEAQRRAKNRYFPHIQAHGQWKQGVQGYLASIAFADAMIGRVLDALESGPNSQNTIVVLWSDHGWHLGEKQHWQKFSPWRVCTRVPLIIKVPAGTKGLPAGTTAGSVSSKPVNLLSLYPTLVDLAGLPAKASNDAPSLSPLLSSPAGDWTDVSMTYLDRPNNYALSDQRYRYIEYANGERELYDSEADPYEWENLAEQPAFAKTIDRLRAKAPTEYAVYVPAKKKVLDHLAWNAASDAALPASSPRGDRFDVYFKNTSQQPVDIFRVDAKGDRYPYGTLERGWFKPYQARSGELWLVTNKKGQSLGYFIVGDESSEAIVP